MILVSSLTLFAAVLVLVLWIRPSDVAVDAPASPTAHLEARKLVIYENLRDLTFEFRLGKLSDADYEKTKHGLQEELAKVMAELDTPAGAAKPAAASTLSKAPATRTQAPTAKPIEAIAEPLVCPHCKARFEIPLKFCGECGKPMAEVKA